MLVSLAVTAVATAGLSVPAAQGPGITIATYNVCKRTCGAGPFAWERRRHAAARSISASGAQVVAVQEAAGTIDWLAARLGPRGYRLAATSTSGCGRGCTQDAFIFYRTDAVEPLGVRPGQGSATLSGVTAVPWAGTYDRAWSWAYLRDRASGAPLLVASVHLPNEKTGQGERLRKAAARGVVRSLAANRQAHGLPGVPTVIAGDLNSFAARQPRGAQRIIARAGYRDAHAAGRKVNARVPTVNVTRIHRDPFPVRPFRFDRPARIDYVFASHARPVRYEVFLRLKSGRFDNRYRASDHNMVVGTFRLG